ncbi:MAG: transglutaminase family protein [Planctomycetes bacterium]|nr:transglutaminase family protein [Planctomycetota bacterium]
MTFRDTACRPEALADFRAALPMLAQTRGLVLAATAIARHELAAADGPATWARLVAIAARIRSRVHSPDPQALLAHAHDELFSVEGYAGARDDYHAPANSYLPTVIARRRGIPIALCLVYKAVLGEIDIEVQGIGAPGHFLARVEVEGAPAFVDPFHGGAVLSTDEAYARVEQVLGYKVHREPNVLAVADPVSWLRRMLRNLEGTFAQAQRDRDRHAMQELAFELETRRGSG